MKIVFLLGTFYLVYLMQKKVLVCQTYDREQDKFRYELCLLGPAAVLGVLATDEYSVSEVLWTTSIWFESVAIIPQLVFLRSYREVENLISHFVGTMGAYRAFYLLNLVYRYSEDGHVNWVGWTGGIVQTALYCDFFFYYAKSKWYGGKLVLPVAT